MTASKLYILLKNWHAVIKNKTRMYNNIMQRYVNRKNRIQNSHISLIIFLAADGGCPPAANFT